MVLALAQVLGQQFASAGILKLYPASGKGSSGVYSALKEMGIEDENKDEQIKREKDSGVEDG